MKSPPPYNPTNSIRQQLERTLPRRHPRCRPDYTSNNCQCRRSHSKRRLRRSHTRTLRRSNMFHRAASRSRTAQSTHSRRRPRQHRIAHRRYRLRDTPGSPDHLGRRRGRTRKRQSSRRSFQHHCSLQCHRCQRPRSAHRDIGHRYLQIRRSSGLQSRRARHYRSRRVHT